MAKNLGLFIENTNTTMVEIAHRIGYSHDLFQQRRLVNAKLLKLSMSNTQRLMTSSMIVKDEDKVDLFFNLDENDKMEWISLLLEASLTSNCLLPDLLAINSEIAAATDLKMAPFFRFREDPSPIWRLSSFFPLAILQLL
ncbi:hypothetical protein HYC85_007126 [Camellia sinensis]|uniref:Uncharacterized protein n=1 Tax=Camellia sinensis TaxID=4442 RepID=A0A7J7HN51_CAMSI|nr:hypothetical protein HYC85_007126 [Camellia sinensis]